MIPALRGAGRGRPRGGQRWRGLIGGQLRPSTFHDQLLKRALNRPRPGSRKADPGMPSSHAQSLAFLGATAALAVWRGGGGPERAVAALSLLTLALLLSWLRVLLGYHTAPQVGAGLALGAAGAAGWDAAGRAWALPAAARGGWAAVALAAATALAVLAFAGVNGRTWEAERARGGV